ncbi:MAG: von Willebrand factor type A domain-containing protein [Bacteroidales bacterium]|nr:von Willebrand factor type A domain-containing protein [Bacteroidales bacterium]
MKQLLLLGLTLLMFPLASIAQKIKVTGNVQDLETGEELIGVSIMQKSSQNSTIADLDGNYSIEVNANDTLIFTYIGYEECYIPVNGQSVINCKLKANDIELEEVVTIGYAKQYYNPNRFGSIVYDNSNSISSGVYVLENSYNTEKYDSKPENNYKNVKTDPISVFSVDVDRASYSNVRRFLNNGQYPPKGSVRVEEMINYFEYSYPEPKKQDPVSLNAEISKCDWNKNHLLLKIGLKAKSLDLDKIPNSNIVFLIDVSWSMYSDNKLPLLVKSFKYLTKNLRDKDVVSIVTYASGNRIRLQPTQCTEEGKQEIIKVLDELEAGGSTAGSDALKKAYTLAQEHFIKGGNNRIILATDGDFNVGPSSSAELKALVEKKAKENNIFLTVLGFGMGNYNDDMMEKMADAGNGNYAYIDNFNEAKKTLGTELWGTLYTVAKDVKVLVDFNPNKVKEYRLIGYEDRLLNNEDFNDDTKDAGDMGSGHTVTALYELVPANNKEKNANVTQSEYVKSTSGNSQNWFTIKFRYKLPEEEKSKLIEKPIDDKYYTENPSEDFKLATSIAEFGMILNDSKYINGMTLEDLLQKMKNVPSDEKGYIDELKVLIRKANVIASE